MMTTMDQIVGRPKGLCPDRTDHKPHFRNSPSLGRFWCTANQEDREPFRSERNRSKTGLAGSLSERNN